MNIMTRLAIIEQILGDVAPEPSDRVTSAPFQRPVGEGRRLIDDLDQAQMLKAASHLQPARHATA